VKQATFLMIGLLTTLMFLALACGGDEATATLRPRATNTPVVATLPAPTAVSPRATATAALTSPPTAAAGANLEIGAKGDALEFDTSSFAVNAGSQVTLTFTNLSTVFQHNWVLTQDGTKDAVAQRGISYPTINWVQPDDPNVIANTKLLNSGTAGSVTFNAPPPGTYQFVCTFPGHNFTMFGAFEVSG
jgi:azurin